MKQMTPKAQHAKYIGIPVKFMDEFDSAYFMICNVSHMLDMGTIIRQMSKGKIGFPEMSEVYEMTQGDDYKMRDLYRQSMFINEMESRGHYDEEKTRKYVVKYLNYLDTI